MEHSVVASDFIQDCRNVYIKPHTSRLIVSPLLSHLVDYCKVIEVHLLFVRSELYLCMYICVIGLPLLPRHCSTASDHARHLCSIARQFMIYSAFVVVFHIVN